MLLAAGRAVVEQLTLLLKQETLRPLLVPLLIVVLSTFFLLLWRLWTFTILPTLRSDEPKELPHWFPFLGHSIAFFKNTLAVVDQGLTYIQHTREPFAIQILGQKLYVLTAPQDVAIAYKNNTTLSWDGYLDELLQAFGLKGHSLKLAWHKPRPGDACYLEANPFNPQQKSLIHLTEDVYKQQLLPGEKLDQMSQSFLRSIDGSVCWEKLDPYCMGSTEKHKYVSLKDFTRTALVDAITASMFGDHLHRIEPNMTRYMLDFNDDAWMVVFRYPQTLARRLSQCRQKIMAALKVYIHTPKEQRTGEAWSIQTVVQAQEITGMDDENRTAMLLMIYWAANSNAYNLCFWLLSYLLFDRPLLESIREETKAAFETGVMDVKYLLRECPRLDAVYHETLRIVNGALSGRRVVAPTKIGGKVLRPGNLVIIPYQQLHYNEQVWGQDPLRFDPERFLKDRNLTSHPAYRPFGGGVSYCPGRVLAQQEVYGFVALLLHRLDIELASAPLGAAGTASQQFPRLDRTKPSLGITGPVDGMDLIIKVREAAHSGARAVA